MNYILLNRNNVVVDILKDRIRYIKLQSNTGYVIACAEDEATGVIGSDANTHYTLIGSDMTNNPNAVRIMKVEEVPEGVSAGNTKFNPETAEFESRYSLAEVQQAKQEENKAAFAAYLNAHPMTWIDGKEYGITQEDQNEITLNLNQYNLAVTAGVESPKLEWHAKHEECYPWPVERLVALSLAISEVVYPVYHRMQQYKTAIFNAETAEEVEAIEIQYEPTEEEQTD